MVCGTTALHGDGRNQTRTGSARPDRNALYVQLGQGQPAIRGLVADRREPLLQAFAQAHGVGPEYLLVVAADWADMGLRGHLAQHLLDPPFLGDRGPVHGAQGRVGDADEGNDLVVPKKQRVRPPWVDRRHA